MFRGRTDAELREEDIYPLLARPTAEPPLRRSRRIETARLLWQERARLLRLALGGLVTSVALAFLLPVRYTSRARLMPPDQEFGSGEAMMAALASKTNSSLSGLGADLLGLKTTGDLFVGMLNSRAVADAVIKNCDLRRVYGLTHEEDVLKQLASRTTVSQDRKSGIITIAVTDRSAARAQAISGEYISQLNRVVTSLNTSSANRERVFLETRLITVKQDLDAAQTAFSDFVSQNKAQAFLDQGRTLINTGAKLSAELGAAQSELAGLREIYADGNVRVRAAQARVKELRRQLEVIGGSAGGKSSPGQEKILLSPSMREMPRLAGTYYDLFRTLRIQQSLFETLTKKYELAKVQEAKQTPSVKVLDPPDFPDRKSFPPRAAIIFLGVTLSALGAGAVVVWESRWQQLSSDDPAKLLAMEVGQKLHSAWGALLRKIQRTASDSGAAH